MPTTANPIQTVLANEGKGTTNVSGDAGGMTTDGLSEKFNPDAFKNGPPTDAQVRAIYEAKYVVGPHFDQIKDPGIQAQMVDWGVNSGPAVAVKFLQHIIGVPQDSILGPSTLQAMEAMNPTVVNNALVAERVKMIGRIVTMNPSQAKFCSGWLNRAVEFIK